MTQQQPFESKGPIMNEFVDTFEPEPHTRMNRFEKMEFLAETTHFDTSNKLLQEMVSWMTDDDFNAFYDDFCSNWDICRSHEELNERYGD